MSKGRNLDVAVVDGFGDEWTAYDQMALDPLEHKRRFEEYFSVFPFAELPRTAEGFDLGCGSGRWAEPLAGRVGLLHCIDPSEKALAVARARLASFPNTRFHLAGADTIPLPDASQDFGYSLGVLHHVPDPQRALDDCVRKLKPGAPFLAYIYYSFENRQGWFKALWRASNVGRRLVSSLPFTWRRGVAMGIAASVYWPLARYARHAERRGHDVSEYPLSYYRQCSFYTMRTDALDRFGTGLEHRFTRKEIEAMMQASGLEDIRFRDGAPHWVACGRKVA